MNYIERVIIVFLLASVIATLLNMFLLVKIVNKMGAIK